MKDHKSEINKIYESQSRETILAKIDCHFADGYFPDFLTSFELRSMTWIASTLKSAILVKSWSSGML